MQIGLDWVETAKSLEEFVSKVGRETSRQVIRTNIATEKRERLVGKTLHIRSAFRGNRRQGRGGYIWVVTRRVESRLGALDGREMLDEREREERENLQRAV